MESIQVVSSADAVEIETGRKRRLIHTDNLMAVVWEFTGGPWPEPDPPHSHPHEQVAYIVEGELLFFMGDESKKLQAGDMVAVPSDAPHSVQLISPYVKILDAFTPIREEFL